MTRIVWGAAGSRYFEHGVDRGVLFVGSGLGPSGGAAVPWNGLTSVTLEPSALSFTRHYVDGYNFATSQSQEELGGTIEAYMYPRELEICLGRTSPGTGFYVDQQKHHEFHFCYRSFVGNDTQGPKAAYKLHLLYNCQAESSQVLSNSIGKDAEADTMSWNFQCRSIRTTNAENTSHFILDSREISSIKMTAIENYIYGTVSTTGRMPSYATLLTMI